MKEEVNYPHIGQFHWQYFQQQDGKRNVAVSSTVPRVEMMLDSGMVKEFTDKKREQNYSVLFDSEYVFEYFYQKIVINMGWENNGKIDINVLRCFLDDFLLHCDAKSSNREQQAVEAQALALSQQFPHKTFKQWKQELLGDIKQEWVGDFDNEIDTQKGQMQQQDDKGITTIDAIVVYAEQGSNNDISEDTLQQESSNDEEKMITMDDYDPDIEEDCGNWEPEISSKGIRDLKRMASNLKIKGYGSMSKDDLIAAIIINKRP